MTKRFGAALVAVLIPALVNAQASRRTQPLLVAHSAPVIKQGGFSFRDLNRNGVVDPYEDWRLSPARRARDLVGRMTIEEKAGMMMHGTARSVGALGVAGVGGEYDTAAVG